MIQQPRIWLDLVPLQCVEAVMRFEAMELSIQQEISAWKTYSGLDSIPNFVYASILSYLIS
jgi:hypothetical protein